MKSKASERVTADYFGRRELFRVYSELFLKYPEGVNFNALYHAVLRHPMLSRVTRYFGNSFDQFMRAELSVEKMTKLRESFDEVLAGYDHQLQDAVVIETKCPIMQAYWIGLLSAETMDFGIPFIQYATIALNDATLTFLSMQQELNGDLSEAEASHFDSTFSFTANTGRHGPPLNIPQMLWHAMLDRDLAVHYTEKYIYTLIEKGSVDIEEDVLDPPPGNSHLH
jgi:hypothetical protein